jgi:hypothetical protein
MTRWFLGISILLVGCGPSYGGQDVKTPEEIVEEQERLAEEQDKQSKEHQASSGGGEDTETDLEKRKKFDKRQADLELKRAQRSAETCAGVVTEEGPTGTANVTLTFKRGHVKTRASPHRSRDAGRQQRPRDEVRDRPPFTGSDKTVHGNRRPEGES